MFGKDRFAKVRPGIDQQPSAAPVAAHDANSTFGLFDYTLFENTAFHEGPEFYVHDHLGNTRVVYTPVVGISSIAYTLSAAIDYFPYGKELRSYYNGEEERYLTTHHERDGETGLDYRGARFYDSDNGRFLSLDPAADEYAEWSVYNYVLGNPISFTDPDGKRPGLVDEVSRNCKSCGGAGGGGGGLRIKNTSTGKQINKNYKPSKSSTSKSSTNNSTTTTSSKAMPNGNRSVTIKTPNGTYKVEVTNSTTPPGSTPGQTTSSTSPPEVPQGMMQTPDGGLVPTSGGSGVGTVVLGGVVALGLYLDIKMTQEKSNLGGQNPKSPAQTPDSNSTTKSDPPTAAPRDLKVLPGQSVNTPY